MTASKDAANVHVRIDRAVWSRIKSLRGRGSLSQIVERSLRKELAEVTVSSQKREQGPE